MKWKRMSGWDRTGLLALWMFAFCLFGSPLIAHLLGRWGGVIDLCLMWICGWLAVCAAKFSMEDSAKDAHRQR